jgi:cytoskeletal protein CcmA (bactofilin family)
MSFFKKTPDQSGSGAMTRDRIGRLVSAGDNGISIIGPGMHVRGDIVTDGTVRVEGRVEGTIRAAQSVVLGKSGEVVGDIVTNDAVIGGHVAGSVLAENRIELQSTAVIEGEIRARTQHLQLDEGARFNGQIHMIEEEEPMRALPAETGVSTGGE